MLRRKKKVRASEREIFAERRTDLFRFFRPRVLVALGFGTLVAVTASGFAAANTVPTSKGGDGAGTISGYTVSNIKYNLNASDPRNIDSVTFDVDAAPPAGATKKIKLVAAGSTWYTCTNVTTAFTCATTSPQATVAASDELRVVIAQS